MPLATNGGGFAESMVDHALEPIDLVCCLTSGGVEKDPPEHAVKPHLADRHHRRTMLGTELCRLRGELFAFVSRRKDSEVWFSALPEC